MNIDKPCHNSFCEPRLQNEGQKKLTDFTDAHGVFTRIFFDLCFFRCKGILNGFASVTACGPQTSINHFHTGTMGIPSSMPSSSYVINRQFQSWCALAYFTSGGTSLL